MLMHAWSTPMMRFPWDGGEASRIEKMRHLKNMCPEALRQVRVCVKVTGSELNCGECNKCVCTLAEMRAAGAESLCESFAKPLDLEVVRRLLYRRDEYWADVIKEATAGGDIALANAARVFMDEKFYWRRFLDNLLRYGRRAAAMGASPDRGVLF